MVSQEQQKQSEELIKTIIKKAWESESFKNQLIKNPVTSIESEIGYKIQPNTNIVVEDQADNSIIYINIPRKVNLDNMELTDEQLEVVAGGEVGIALGIIAVVAIIGSGYAFAAYND